MSDEVIRSLAFLDRLPAVSSLLLTVKGEQPEEVLPYLSTMTATPADVLRALDTEIPRDELAAFAERGDVYLFFDFHHILFDGSSLNVFMQDVDRALAGEDIEKETYTIFDLAEDEAAALAKGADVNAKKYYDTLMSGASGCTTLDGDRKEKEDGIGFRPGRNDPQGA